VQPPIIDISNSPQLVISLIRIMITLTVNTSSSAIAERPRCRVG